MGRLERKIDQDLVDRILAGWKPKKGESKRTSKKRDKGAYQAPPPVFDGSFKGPVRLNRSKKWKEAKTYDEARAQRHREAAE